MRWCAGIVNHGNYDDLEGCLASLRHQTVPPSTISVYDTGLSKSRFEALRVAHPAVRFELGANRGYAGGANRVIESGRESDPEAEYVLVSNPDIEFASDHAEIILREMARASDAVIGGGKLLRFDGVTLDSAGIRIPRHRRPRDRGSDEPDRGGFDTQEYVDAVSGAAMMLRRSAIDSLAIDGQLFDETFFAYHEDTDLCWRARVLGWQILYVPAAVALHRRGWQRHRRREIPIEIRRHSFKNHYLQVVKNESGSGFLRNLPWLLGWEVLRLGFVLLRDRAMAPAYLEAWRALPDARRKRGLIRARAHEKASRSR